nr:hypothetical protein Iba_chr03aCG2330 [Ipomoea batatas]
MGRRSVLTTRTLSDKTTIMGNIIQNSSSPGRASNSTSYVSRPPLGSEHVAPRRPIAAVIPLNRKPPLPDEHEPSRMWAPLLLSIKTRHVAHVTPAYLCPPL